MSLTIALKALMLKIPFYNCKKTRTTFDARLTICISFANERKTQEGWVVNVG